MPMEGDLKMFDINELKKDLYRSKNMAKFSHYEIGNVYYMVDIAEGKYQFPIATVEKGELPLILQLIEKRIKEIKEFLPEEKAKEEIEKLNKEFDKIFILSEDLGITPFYADIRGSELIRWIQKAIKNEQFIKIG
jgi:hypothetical protein